MKRAVVALLVSFSMLGCFPHNATHRRYAKIAEGGALVGGIVISAVANTGADCDTMQMAGADPSDCRTKAKWLSTLGVALILGGLLGFVATISTAEDEDKTVPVQQSETNKPAETTPVATPPVEQAPAPTPAATDTPPPADGSGSGSATDAGSATTPPAPPQ